MLLGNLRTMVAVPVRDGNRSGRTDYHRGIVTILTSLRAK